MELTVSDSKLNANNAIFGLCVALHAADLATFVTQVGNAIGP